MAVSMRVKSAPAACRASSRRASVVVKATSENKLPLAAVALAASALLSSSAAEAGVVLQAQPEVKKLFQSSGAPAAPVERPFRQPGAASSAPAVKAEAPKPKKVEESGSDGLDPRSVALPASIAAIAGLGFAISKVDDGFTEWFSESGALVRNSGAYAGFEEDIKGAELAAATGTRSTKTGSKAGSKKGGTTKK